MIRDLLEFFVPPIIFIILIVSLLVGIFASFDSMYYFNNTANEEIILDGNLIYSGEGRIVVWKQLGEVGNKYEIKQYKPGYWNRFFEKVEKCWVGTDLVVNNINN